MAFKGIFFSCKPKHHACKLTTNNAAPADLSMAFQMSQSETAGRDPALQNLEYLWHKVTFLSTVVQS